MTLSSSGREAPMRRTWRLLVTFTVCAAVIVTTFSVPAVARSRVLWRSPDLVVRGELIGKRAIVSFTNRTDYVVNYSCRFKTSPVNSRADVRTKGGSLNPAEIDTLQFRRQAALPTAKRCTVNVDTDVEIVSASDAVVVHYSSSEDEIFTGLSIYNKTASSLRLACTWWQPAADTPGAVFIPGTWLGELQPYGSGFVPGGVFEAPLGPTFQLFSCVPAAPGYLLQVPLPAGVTTFFTGDALLVTRQDVVDASGSNYYLFFINQTDVTVTASCSWTDSHPGLTDQPQTWTATLQPYGWSGAVVNASGGTEPITSTGVTCTTTPIP
jgi:hypothetical protein